MKKIKRVLVGGPWSGEVLRIGFDGTLTFSVRDYHGYYDSLGYWHDSR